MTCIHTVYMTYTHISKYINTYIAVQNHFICLQKTMQNIIK